MKRGKTICTTSLAGLMLLAALLTGCTQETDDASAVRHTLTVSARAAMLPYAAAEEGMSRAWTPPTGYDGYDVATLTELFPWRTSLTNAPIDVFFTRDGQEPVNGRLFYGTNGEWHSTSQLNISSTYYVYGFIPYNSSLTATIAANSTYSEGAVLTIRGLDCVTATETCVIVGAKEGSDIDTDNGIGTGNFSFTTSGSEHNYMFLLFDHLYSAVRLRFKVDPTYDALRTIKLKEVTLQPYSDPETRLTSKADVVVSLRKTTDGSSPIQSVSITPHSGTDYVEAVLFSDDEGLPLSTTPTEFQGSFAAAVCSKYVMRSRYDIYDKQGNLTRKDCTAQNLISVGSAGTDILDPLRRGQMQSLTVTVNPTYLYVMSDPDLSDPPFEVTQ